jgi:hypothetical protein
MDEAEVGVEAEDGDAAAAVEGEATAEAADGSMVGFSPEYARGQAVQLFRHWH